MARNMVPQIFVRNIAHHRVQIEVRGVHLSRLQNSRILSNRWLLDEQQNRTAHHRCYAVLLNQLERLVHAHEAELSAGDSSCQDDVAN